MKDLLEYLQKEWRTLRKAPLAFSILFALAVGVSFAALSWRYEAIVEKKDAVIEALGTEKAEIKKVLKDSEESLENFQEKTRFVASSSKKLIELKSLDPIAQQIVPIVEAGNFKTAIVLASVETQNPTDALKTLIASEFAVALTKVPKSFILLERSLIAEVLREQSLARDGDVLAKQDPNVMRILGAEAFIFLSITETDKHVHVIAKVVDAATSGMFGAASGNLEKI